MQAKELTQNLSIQGSTPIRIKMTSDYLHLPWYSRLLIHMKPLIKFPVRFTEEQDPPPIPFLKSVWHRWKAGNPVSRQVPVLVDNTTATAALQRPMDLGADFVLLSISKFLAGNGTLLGGAVVGPEGFIEDIRWNTTEFIGAIMQPMEAWMTLQYLETLSMRMEKHSANTMAVAQYLKKHPKVVHVNYSGLIDHPQHDLACRQMNGHGGLLSFVVKGGMEGAATVMNSLKLIVHAVTFGTSRTVCMHPPTITHEHLTPKERLKAGIDDGLIRLSVGLENPEDLIRDLDRALI